MLSGMRFREVLLFGDAVGGNDRGSCQKPGKQDFTFVKQDFTFVKQDFTFVKQDFTFVKQENT